MKKVIPLCSEPAALLAPSPSSKTGRSAIGNWSTHNKGAISAAMTEPA